MADLKGQETSRWAIEMAAAGRHTFLMIGPAGAGKPMLAALVGGGVRAKAGEISLAHNGALFLDELAEFSRPVLYAPRQPLETGQVVVAQANHHVTHPARFQLVAAMNLCRCGYLGDPARAFSCALQCGRNYSAQIFGHMLDRFDIIIEVPEVSGQILFSTKAAEASSTIATRVAAAEKIRRKQ